jgi:lysophospholipid acyltransferase (LPLAT)-like uncharacterized protein
MTYVKTVKFFFIKKIIKILIHLIVIFNKVEIKGYENLDDIKKKESIIFVFWHKKILFTIYQFKNSGARPLISNSDDGELVSQVAEEFNMIPIRGSSSRGGARAFIKMMHSIRKEKSHILITADGPKGPAEQIKDGTVKLAEKTGAVIIPISWTASKVKVFQKSWDKFELPLPFGKIKFKYGKPIYINIKNDTDKYKELIKKSINNLEINT